MTRGYQLLIDFRSCTGVVGSFLALALFCPLASAQNIDCKNPKSRAEQLICTTSWLSDIQQQLDETYAKALPAARASGKESQLQRDQADWLKTRDTCSTAECVLRVEKQRIAYLLSISDPGTSKTTPNPPPAGQEKGRPPSGSPGPGPKPLFEGQIGVRSSQKGKESATLGFNGIDPSGKVQQSFLSASPKSADVAFVHDMDTKRPTRAELVAFAREGGLQTK